MPRAVTNRQAQAMIIAATGPVNVGKWDKCTYKEDLEVAEAKPLDGTTELGVSGYGYAGTLSHGLYNQALANLLWAQTHPGVTDPPRLILLVTTEYNDGVTGVDTYRGVLLVSRGRDDGRGFIQEVIDWRAEDKDTPV